MQKKKIINKKHIPSYSVCRKWGKLKVINFSHFNEYLNEMNFPIWVMKKQKIGIKKPFAEYIGKITIDEYMAMKPKTYKYIWSCILHAGTCTSKITDWDYYRNIEQEIKQLSELASKYKGKIDKEL